MKNPINFQKISKTHLSYPLIYKKCLEASKSKKTAENSLFFKNLWKVNKKPIEKAPLTRKPFANITNLAQNRQFLEDSKGTSLKNHDFEIIHFLHSKTKEILLFPCFNEKDLKIPSEFVTKTISHSLDNDVTTDEEQIKNAITNLKASIKEQIDKKSPSKKPIMIR